MANSIQRWGKPFLNWDHRQPHPLSCKCMLAKKPIKPKNIPPWQTIQGVLVFSIPSNRPRNMASSYRLDFVISLIASDSVLTYVMSAFVSNMHKPSIRFGKESTFPLFLASPFLCSGTQSQQFKPVSTMQMKTY